MNKNSQAFPIIGEIQNIHDGGMTLADYFAAKVLVVLVDNNPEDVQRYKSDKKLVVKTAYQLANLMVKERSKKTDDDE